MEIRLARRSDLDRIIGIRRDAFGRMASTVYTKAEVETLLDNYSEEEFIEMISDKRMFVATIDGIIRGTAAWAGTNIRHVYIDPDFFGLNIGTELVARTEADYQKRTQGTFINAEVILYARGFYEKCGYILEGLAKDWDGSEYWQMSKPLPAL